MEPSPIQLADLNGKQFKKGDTVFCASCGAITFLGVDMFITAETKMLCGSCVDKPKDHERE